MCCHGCGNAATGAPSALGLGYCDRCDADQCLVGPDGVCGAGENAAGTDETIRSGYTVGVDYRR
jgi:hypothetical protein